MNKHTPRPWVIVGPLGEGNNTHYFIRHESPGRSGGVHCVVDTLHKSPEALATCEANARLIAAAPNMLEALQRLEPMLSEMAIDCAADIQEGGSGGGLETVNLALCALAKATGKAVADE